MEQIALPLNAKQLASDAFAKFLLAGNALFTVVSKATGNRFTYKVRQPNPDAPFFISVLTGENNESDYTFLGSIFNRERYAHGSKSSISENALSAKGAKWLVTKVLSHGDLGSVEIYHAGKCGRCGRTLTVPESIECGIGPECIKHV